VDIEGIGIGALGIMSGLTFIHKLNMSLMLSMPWAFRFTLILGGGGSLCAGGIVEVGGGIPHSSALIVSVVGAGLSISCILANNL
jgi:hypothetical protein